MQPVDNKKEDKKATVVQRAVSSDEEGRKKAEREEMPTRNIDTIKYLERKLEDKGIQRRERHPADGIGIGRPPPKSGHGGKYTWEGPDGVAENELTAVPPAIDEKDPNYVNEEEEEKVVNDVGELVVGEVDVAKAAEDRKGVARVEVDPHLEV
ncbi:glucomannan 4-beta-mannosyltransferase 9-like [Hibiscus syriacus]|uniref:Glucomannan 4-beta-mannosyltransferase 9-like n=1 Tax=Hibiscus syriacus TaxID=106335 RepID=A0A6A2ZDS1_HIBSY|nr:uncharacterized protein LOC120146512 [Hibiscus syriacus]KAE8690058.1 glucomannan 4-beta-mannosyltransferase 9-like [Hibiscus syriacus]